MRRCTCPALRDGAGGTGGEGVVVRVPWPRGYDSPSQDTLPRTSSKNYASQVQFPKRATTTDNSRRAPHLSLTVSPEAGDGPPLPRRSPLRPRATITLTFPFFHDPIKGLICCVRQLSGISWSTRFHCCVPSSPAAPRLNTRNASVWKEYHW